MRIWRLIILASFAAAAVHAQPEAGLWRFLPPDARAIVGLNWGRAGQSELGPWLRRQWLESEAAAVAGPEFLNDVDYVLISSSPLLIAMQGRFNPAKLRSHLLAHGAKVQVFGSMAIYRPPGKVARDLAFAPLDARTVLAGDAHSVYEAIERIRTPATEEVRNGLLTRARQMSSRYHCWALLQAAGALSTEHFSLGVFGVDEFSADARAVEAGISFGEGLTLTAVVTARSDAAARKAATSFQRLITLAARDRSAQPALALLASKLRIGVEHGSVLISAKMNRPETAAMAGYLSKEDKTTVATTSPPEPKRPIIQIDGLDEGPREVPYRR